jgi:predicted phage tail protein
MRTTVAAVVCIFSLFMVCGVILTVLRERETAAMLFTSGISFLMGCGITVISRENNGESKRQEMEKTGSMF